MNMISFGRLGLNRATPRIWIESARLSRLGFAPGTPVCVTAGARSVTIRCASNGVGRTHTVSQRRAAGGLRPVLDIENARTLAGLVGFEELRFRGSHGQIIVTPSVRAFHIARSRAVLPPFRVLEVFCGGGTLTAALAGNPLFRVVGGVEMDPAFADVWQAAHPDSLLIQSDFRLVTPSELPAFDVLVLGLPCTDHSALGRAKKGLAGALAEGSGNAGDLFVHALALVQSRMPAAIVVENVVGFAGSPAGLALRNNLQHLGYDVATTVLEPNSEWAEPCDRRRFLLTATLRPGFSVHSPGLPFTGRIGDFLDMPDSERDAVDCARIATAVAGLRRHNARHAELGHNFHFTTLNGTETVCPTIVRSYHKVNVGPFVQCPAGLRLLRQAEIERLHGTRVATGHYTTAVQILGQGVQTRVFGEVFRQLGAFLAQQPAPPLARPVMVGEEQLDLFC